MAETELDLLRARALAMQAQAQARAMQSQTAQQPVQRTPAQQADILGAFDRSFQPRGPAGMSVRSAPVAAQPPVAQQQGPGILGTIRDNLIGDDDPTTLNPGERAAAFLNRAGESMTMGLVGDEAAAAADAAIGRGDYDERLALYRQQEEQLGAGGRLAADVAGVLAAPAGAATRFVLQAPGRAAQALRAAGVGAGSGFVYGGMEGEGDVQNRLTNAAVTGALGSLFGAASPRISEVLTGIPRGVATLFQRAQERPTVEALRAAKNAAYNAAENAGIAFDGAAMQRLSQTVRQAFDADNYVDDVDDASRAVLRILENREGVPTTLGQLDSIRQNLWARYSRASDQPRILDAIRAIDELIETSDIGGELMAAARAANARFAKTQLLENAFTRAQDQVAGTGSGGNIVNKFRQAVTSIINNPRQSRFFSQAEIDVMRQFVRGTTTENVQRLIGKLSPSGNGLMMALHIFGGIQSGGLTIPLMGVGAASKALADRGVTRGADMLMDMTAGVRQPAAMLPQAVSPLAPAMTTAAIPQLESAQQVVRNALRLGQ